MRNAQRSVTRTCLQFTVVLAVVSLLVPAALAQSVDEEFAALIVQVNLQLAAEGADHRLGMIEYITGDPDKVGNTVLAHNVGNKQMALDFVPGDPRRGWSAAAGTAMTYAIDSTGDSVPFAGGLVGAQTDAAIVRASNSWDALRCSNLGFQRNPAPGIDIGRVAWIVSGGPAGNPFPAGSPAIVADVQHAGWRDLNFGGGVLGATFTFWFGDGSGNPTDIDNNGKGDTAFREIYYDPIDPNGIPWIWADDGVSNIDVESVAAHEVGHGLSQTHFGRVFLDKKGNLKHAPKAVMNAAYTGPQRTLLGTDSAGHCSNWAQWPNN